MRTSRNVAWLQTVDRLSNKFTPLPLKHYGAEAQSHMSYSVTCVEVVERLSTLTIAVSLSGPTIGRQDYQTWRLKHAPYSGRCLLGGRRIKEGDWVYQPHFSNSATSQKGYMILRVKVEETLSQNSFSIASD